MQIADNLTTFAPIDMKYCIIFEILFRTVYVFCFIFYGRMLFSWHPCCPWDYRDHVTTFAAAKTVAGPLIHGRG